MKEYIAKYGSVDLGDGKERLYQTVVISGLIRCKDCKHYNGGHRTCYHGVWAVENGYCWMAEREEDDSR